jgi:penicillin-binding protein 1A
MLRAVAFGTLVLGLLLAGQLLHHVYRGQDGLPDLEAFIRFETPTTGAVYDASGQLLIELAREYREIVSYDEIPAVVRDAVLSAEDKNFFTHEGVDYAALPRVALKNLQAATAAVQRWWTAGGRLTPAFVQGGSTITQQLVRGYFLADLTRRENTDTLLHRSPATRLSALLVGVRATNKMLRKIEEARISLWLEDALATRFGSQQAKEMIFSRYASFVYLGGGRYGLAAASEYYFDKPLQSYTSDDADEAALLAAIIKSPRDYAPTAPNIDRALRRRNHTLMLMAKRGVLPAAAAQRAMHASIDLASRHEVEVEAPAVVANVLDELKQGATGFGVEDLVQGRIRVHTTLDNRIQPIASAAVENGIRLYERRQPQRKGVQAAAVVLRNADGAILAEVGGRRVHHGQAQHYTDFNRAIQSVRQPGSAFKPFVYLAAFRQGFALDTYVLDEPIEVPTARFEVKSIANFDHAFKGPITVRQALAESRNAATMWTANQIGMESIVRTARDVGLRTPLQPYLSTALGASEVTLVDLANAYRALASGVTAVPHVIDKLTNARGDALYTAPETGDYLPIAELGVIQEGLRGVVRLPGGTGRALNGRAFPIDVLGKTGTSNNFRDALFVGSTYGPTGITVAVWVGHDDGQSLGNGETGGKTALPIFREVIETIYRQELVGPAPEFPPGLDRGIDAYLNEEAILLAHQAERPFVARHELPYAVMQGGPPEPAMRSGISFAAPYDDTPPPPRGRAPFHRTRERPTRRAGSWVCRRVSSGLACVAEASAPRAWRPSPPPPVAPSW